MGMGMGHPAEGSGTHTSPPARPREWPHGSVQGSAQVLHGSLLSWGGAQHGPAPGPAGRSLPLSPVPLCKHTSAPGAAVCCRQPESRKGGEVAQLLSPSQQVWLALPGRWLRAWQRRAPAPGAAGSIRARAKSGAAEQCGERTGGGRGSDLPCQPWVVAGSSGLCTHLGFAASSCIPWGPRERCWQGSAVPWRGQVPLGDNPRGHLCSSKICQPDSGASPAPWSSWGLELKSPRVAPALSHQSPAQFCSLLPGLMICWAIHRLAGNPVRAWPGTTLLFLSSQVGETALFHPLTVTVLLCSSWHSRAG